MARAAAAARAAAPARAPRHAPRRPVRPATPRRRSSAGRKPSRPRTLPERLAGIQRSPFVDRLLGGRAGIVLVAGLLAGIVAANVALLELIFNDTATTE